MPACAGQRGGRPRRARPGDVSKEEDAVRMVQDTVGELGGIDVLVNNAGIQISRPSHELSRISRRSWP